MSSGSLSIIAQRYSTALLSLADDNNLLDIFKTDLNTIKLTLDNSDELKLFLNHPTVATKDKKEVIEEIFKNKVNDLIINLVKLLLDKNRFFIFVAIVSNYNHMLNEKRNISMAQVITAIEISDEVKNKIKEKLEKVFKINIEIESKINSEIIAGMIVKVGDKVIDGSIKTKLENMKKQVL